MRLDLVDPEAVFHYAARPVQQLLELAQCEGSYLWEAHRHGTIRVTWHFQSKWNSCEEGINVKKIIRICLPDVCK